MKYPINVKPHDIFDIAWGSSHSRYCVEPDPLRKTEPYFESGGTGAVLKLTNITSNQAYALKMFNLDLPSEYQIEYAHNLRRLNLDKIAGLSVAHRLVLSPDTHNDIIQKHGALKYALLMPWVEGRTWQEILIQNKIEQADSAFSKNECFRLGMSLCKLLYFLEQNQCAHCDLCSNNLVVKFDDLVVELIDIEDMYGPGFVRNPHFIGGQKGYTHQRSQLGHQWCEESDRFGGAILMAEMFGWFSADIRASSGEESFFSSNQELHDTKTEKFHRLAEVLADQTSPDVVALFLQSWTSDDFSRCSSFAQWYSALIPIAAKRGIDVDEIPSGVCVVQVSPHSDKQANLEPAVDNMPIAQSHKSVILRRRVIESIKLNELNSSSNRTDFPYEQIFLQFPLNENHHNHKIFLQRLVLVGLILFELCIIYLLIILFSGGLRGLAI